MIRLLKASEIDCRVAQITDKGLSILLYKDARVDMAILDETFGPCGWQRSHQIIGDSLYCTVSIWDSEQKQWVAKQDVGTESAVEAEKGLSSDSFKRACTNVGIGRELYTAPQIWISAEDADIKTGKSGRRVCYDKFFVEQILYDEDTREITALAIKNARTGKRVFMMDKRKK